MTHLRSQGNSNDVGFQLKQTYRLGTVLHYLCINSKYVDHTAHFVFFLTGANDTLGASSHTFAWISVRLVGKLIPLHRAAHDKQVDKRSHTRNRPISVLPILINSIFERHISNCLVDYLESNNLLYNHQSGFRRLHSCQTALTKIVDNWLNAINNSETVGTVFLDLTKAFDLVNHKLLIQKLAAYKFSSSTQSWFQSCLTNRSQQVNISGKLSDPQHIAAGVPQGSVLGPLLFLIYINDLPLSIQTCILELFADDATLSCSDPSILNLTNCLNEDLKNFQDWCIRNDMVVNVPKAKAMFIASRNAANRILENNQDLKLSDETIHITLNEKLLGVHIDNTLSWTAQVESTIKKNAALYYTY